MNSSQKVYGFCFEHPQELNMYPRFFFLPSKISLERKTKGCMLSFQGTWRNSYVQLAQHQPQRIRPTTDHLGHGEFGLVKFE